MTNPRPSEASNIDDLPGGYYDLLKARANRNNAISRLVNSIERDKFKINQKLRLSVGEHQVMNLSFEEGFTEFSFSASTNQQLNDVADFLQAYDDAFNETFPVDKFPEQKIYYELRATNVEALNRTLLKLKELGIQVDCIVLEENGKKFEINSKENIEEYYQMLESNERTAVLRP